MTEINETEYYRIIQSSIDGFWINDIQGRVLDVNEAYCALVGYSRDELLDMHIADLEVVEKPEEAAARIQKVMEIGSDRFAARHRCKDGKIVDIEISVTYLPAPNGKFFVFVRDITGRMQVEEALQQSEQRYRSVINNIAIGIAVISPNMEILSLNGQMMKWFPEINILDKPICYKTFNTPQRETICSYCPTILTLKDGLVHETITDTPAGDKVINFRVLSSPIRNKDGEVVAAIEMVEDVTELRRAEQALKESENKFRDLSEKSLVGIYLIQDGIFEYVNPVMAEIFGYSVDELTGKKGPVDLVLPEDWPNVKENIRKRNTGEMKAAHYEFRGLKKNSDVLFIEAYGSRTVYKERPAVIGSLLDITQRKKDMEERERLIGELREAVVTIKTLQGILPICSSCKKIRDDKGYWSQLEKYITEHSSAEFSHSICPDCTKKLYPDYYDRLFEGD
ncbi:MAG: PAS domain S-box protein [Nitrospirae bacterium]|nr:MAG: PAS domain S-box protein [Nitrospirota bacterium]